MKRCAASATVSAWPPTPERPNRWPQRSPRTLGNYFFTAALSPTFSIAFVVALGAACLWLLWRDWRLRRLLIRANDALRAEPGSSDAAIETFRGISNSAPEEMRRLLRSVIDSTSEARTEAEYRNYQRQFLEALLNQIEDALFVLDGDLRVSFSNRAAQALFAAEAPHDGRSLIEVCLDHRIVETVTLALKTGGKTQDQIERKAASPTGANRVEASYLIEAEPLVASAHSPADSGGAWLLIRDITQKREIEQIRQDFVANASHELRTPLSIIHGYLEMLDSDTVPEPATLQRMVKTMTAHSDRIIRIVEDMLTISRLESDDGLLRRENFELSDCIRETISQLQPIIGRQQAEVTLDLADDVGAIYGDRFYWNQIFFNLIENALKQNRKRPLKIRVSVREKAGRATIIVSDDGVGIRTADLPLIFKRFYRAEKHHSQATKGTGLGLSIVKRAVEAHAGTVRAESQPGRRTAFIIEVPLASGPVSAAVRSTKTDAEGGDSDLYG